VNATTKYAVVVFVFALALRLSMLSFTLPKLRPDVDLDSYRSLGRSLAAGKGFVAPSPDGRELPNVGRTPTYPLFLACLIRIGGDRLGLFLAVQCVLGALTAGLTVVLAARWLRPQISLLAGLLVAVDPNSVMRCADLRTETSFTLLLVSGACFVAWWPGRKSSWFAAGLVWSLAALDRPIALWIWVVVVVVIGMRRRSRLDRMGCLAMFLAGYCPLLGIWVGRNYAVTGCDFVSSISTYNLLMYRAAGVEAQVEGRQLEDVKREFRARYGDVQYVEDRARFQQSLAVSQRAAIAKLCSSPVALAEQTVLGWGKLLFGPGVRALGYSLGQSEPPSRWWPPLYSLALLAVVLLSVVGARRLGRESILPALLLLYFVALAGGPESNSRFRVPVTPMLAVLAVAGAYGPEKKR
jgi:hypothetical protein